MICKYCDSMMEHTDDEGGIGIRGGYNYYTCPNCLAGMATNNAHDPKRWNKRASDSNILHLLEFKGYKLVKQ